MRSRTSRSNNKTNVTQCSIFIVFIISIIELFFEIAYSIIFLLGVVDTKTYPPLTILILVLVLLSLNVFLLLFVAIAPTFPVDQNPFYADESTLNTQTSFINNFSIHFAKQSTTNLLTFILITVFYNDITANDPMYPMSSGDFPGESREFIIYKTILVVGLVFAVINITHFIDLIQKSKSGTRF